MKHLSRIFVALLALQAPAALGATISHQDIAGLNQDLINSPTGAKIGGDWRIRRRNSFHSQATPTASGL